MLRQQGQRQLPDDAALDVGEAVELVHDDGRDVREIERLGMQQPVEEDFGNDDQHPSPDQVAELDKALTEAGKDHEFHSYDGAGHAFFAVNRPAYRPETAMDGWQKIWDFYGRHLAG